MKSISDYITINFVDYPPQRKFIEPLKRMAIEKGFRFNLEPYVDIKKDLGLGKRKSCRAGVDYFMIVPNGDVWRCNTAFNYHYFVKKIPKFRLGNVFDGTFKPLTKATSCSLKCVHGCDLYFRGKYKGVMFEDTFNQ